MSEQKPKSDKKRFVIFLIVGFVASWVLQWAFTTYYVIPNVTELIVDQRNRFLQDAEYLGTHTDCKVFLKWHYEARVMTGFTDKLTDKMYECGGVPYNLPEGEKPLDFGLLVAKP